MKVTFGTRGSALALAQTEQTISRVVAGNPGLQIKTVIIKTTGDKFAQASLSQIGGQGAFTREIEQALLSGTIDVAVHSLKDLPLQQPPGLCIAVIAERRTPADALVSSNGASLDSLPEGARVGTSSLRRKVQLLLARPDLRVEELRGNLPTRLAVVQKGGLDAVVIALAGLTRLGRDTEPGLYEIPLSQMLPAPGQGALALEIRTADEKLAGCLKPLHDPAAAAAVYSERAVLKAFGGGCRAPLGVFAQGEGDTLHLEALAVDCESGRHARIRRHGLLNNGVILGLQVGNDLRRELEG